MITKDFAHIHLTRCGGSMVRNVLHRLSQQKKIVLLSSLPHQPLSNVREIVSAVQEARAKEMTHIATVPFGFVRNPFDFHISWWRRELEMGRFQGSFKEYLVSYPSHEYCPSMKPDERLPGCRMLDHYKHMGYMEIDRCNIGQLESFTEDLVRILTTLDPKLKRTDIMALFPQAYRANYGVAHVALVEQHMRGELYDSQMRQWVERYDGYILKKFGYTFEDRWPVSRL